MPLIKVKMRLIDYGRMLASLDDMRSDGDCFKLVSSFRHSVKIINDELTADEGLVVQVNIDSDDFMRILKQFSESHNPEGNYRGMFTDKLVDEFKQRMDDKAAEEAERAEYNKWLTERFDEFVKSADAPCSSVARDINEQYRNSPYTPLKYQNIMRPLKIYKKDKFSEQVNVLPAGEFPSNSVTDL